MRFLLTCLALFLAFASTIALAGEEQFTLRIEHYEDSARPAFNRAAFQGRQWDLNGLLRATEARGSLQWIQMANERGGSALGNTYCLRIRQTLDGKMGGALVNYQQRLRELVNLRTQLKLREQEMIDAGALYRVELPARCGESNDTRLSRKIH